MNKKRLKTCISIIPLIFLIAALAVCISIFGSDSILGASQVALLLSSGVCCFLAMTLFHVKWTDIEKSVCSEVGGVTTAIVILLFIGAVSGTWTMSGIVPTFICWGIKLISPRFFLMTACLICCIISVLIGSSWTTIATIGVALLGIGKAMGFGEAVIAGAIVSGAYFGDKMSPMSDTTVLASSLGGTPLFKHIKYMSLTTVPAIVITLLIFTVIGLMHENNGADLMHTYSEVLSSKFNLTPWLMLVPVLTGFMIWKRLPAIVVLSVSALAAGIFALIFQPGIVQEVAVGQQLDTALSGREGFTGFCKMIYDEVGVATGNADIDRLVSTRGMTGMLNTIYLILCAMCFGGCMKATRMIHHIASLLMPFTRKRAGLVASTVVTGTALNGIVSDQYLAIILTSNIFKDIFEKNGYENRLLSRSVEDSATVTSPLFPWSSCGMTQATILGVSTFAYAPFCFFNILCPIMSIIVALIGYKIVPPANKM